MIKHDFMEIVQTKEVEETLKAWKKKKQRKKKDKKKEDKKEKMEDDK